MSPAKKDWAVLGCGMWPFNWGAAAFKGWRGDAIRSLQIGLCYRAAGVGLTCPSPPAADLWALRGHLSPFSPGPFALEDGSCPLPSGTHGGPGSR